MKNSNKVVLRTEDLVKTFGEGELEIHAVDHISLEIGEGEFTAIKGPSGSGKTTLLNLLGGLDHPSAGKVIVDGVDLSQLLRNQLVDLRLNKIGFVFQAYNLIPVLTARENTEFIMLLQDRPKEERIERASQLLKAVGLNGHEDKRPGKLSGGQQQRVAVARALAPKPSFILADEPTANLDSKSTANLLDIMKRLNEEEKMTFVFATHDDRVIKRAKRVITVDDGKIVEDIWAQEMAG